MKKLMVANWKMNPVSYAEAEKLVKAVLKVASKLKNVETVFCPPFVFIQRLAMTKKLINVGSSQVPRLDIGAQDIFWEKKGAYTGEISPLMLKNLGVRYVIIGHSERRRHLGETDEMVNKKVSAALKAGLRVILCIGETLGERKAGNTNTILRKQFTRALSGISRTMIGGGMKLVITYEPIWAISAGTTDALRKNNRAATPQDAEEAARYIRKLLKAKFGHVASKQCRMIYGGSTNASNILGFLAMPEIQGALVGGASLDAKEFSKMLRIANEI